jgi:hypothetical protein
MNQPKKPLFLKLKDHFTGQSHGQSFVELALILPILLLMLAGVVETSFFIARYLDVLDLTREAARFASVRDPFGVVAADYDCSTQNYFSFYYDTSCIFSPPAGSAACTNAAYCNGLNSYAPLDLTTDDVVVSVFTITAANALGNPYVSNTWPAPNGRWALSDLNTDVNTRGNWQKDCRGNTVRTTPHFTPTVINSTLNNAFGENKGYVAVEVFYCYHQVLNLPFFTIFVPNPLQIDAYTLMPLPAAQPTPTTTAHP